MPFNTGHTAIWTDACLALDLENLVKMIQRLVERVTAEENHAGWGSPRQTAPVRVDLRLIAAVRFPRFLWLVLFCSTLAALGQPATAERERDQRGFLASPAPAETKPNPSAVPPVGKPVPALATNAPALSAPGDYVLDDKHKLGPGDRIGFRIVEDRTNALQMLVAESSELDIPYIGRVNVAGKTCKQAAEDIKSLLEKDYYYKATVVIGLDALSKVVGKVYVFGPVRNPGPVEIPAGENFTLSKAILRVGGFGDFANRKKIQIVRKTETGTETIIANLEDVLVRGRIEEDITLKPEDFIIVPQRAVNW